MKKKIIISAYNVHHGGGKVLLEGLLDSLNSDNNLEATLFLDSRFSFDSLNGTIIRVRPRLWHRIKAEKMITELSSKNDLLLCFGNLPPLFKSQIPTFIYLQNKYLISRQFICWDNIRTALRTFVEKIWFEVCKSHQYTYFVQTPSMRSAFKKNQGSHLKCEVFGFAPVLNVQQKIILPHTPSKLLYVASGEPHKNHVQLLKALVELKHRGSTPELTLTIDRRKYPSINALIEEYKSSHQLAITNWPSLTRESVLKLYLEHDALVFPSYLESFGLPLIEAQQIGLPIIASDCDFVHDVVKPVETFNPHSSTSIADALSRFFKRAPIITPQVTTIKTPQEFLWRLTNS